MFIKKSSVIEIKYFIWINSGSRRLMVKTGKIRVSRLVRIGFINIADTLVGIPKRPLINNKEKNK